MKIHRPIVQQAINCLEEIFFNNQYADKAIERAFKAHRQWGARDRRFFAETVYDIVRYWRKYWHILGVYPESNTNKLEQIVSIYLQEKNIETPPWLSTFKVHKDQFDYEFAIQQSLPDWLDQLGREQIGEQWQEVAEKLNQPAEVVLRTNTNRIAKTQLIKELALEQVVVESIADAPSALRLLKRTNVFKTEAFKKGWFEVQDASSQGIAPLLDLSPGMRVIDACAGAGGKSLHIADLLKNKGKIISLDIHAHKLQELKIRARRNGCDIIETRVIENQKVIKRLHNSADRLLLDVPCSGLGVLRRNPDSKWKLSPQKISEVNSLQKEIISNYSQMLKPKGIMVYATCSILPIENQKVVEHFLSNHVESWVLKEQKIWWPHRDGYDGFYAAVLEKVK